MPFDGMVELRLEIMRNCKLDIYGGVCEAQYFVNTKFLILFAFNSLTHVGHRKYKMQSSKLSSVVG